MTLKIPWGYSEQVEREIINARFDSVFVQPGLIDADPLDLSDMFYDTRKRLDEEGYDVSPLNDEKTGKRKALYSYVKTYCDKIVYCRWCKKVRPRIGGRREGETTCSICHRNLYQGIKRHEIGIFPADRAILYFKGKEYSVNFKNYKQLAYLGTDILCVEKQDTATKLKPYTMRIGIALLQSRGFIAECAKWLAKEAAKTGAHVIVLTDFDASGVDIAFQLEGVTRLGVDPNTVEWLNNHRDKNKDKVLDIDKLTESSLNKRGEAGTHWEHLKLVLGYDIPELRCNGHNIKYIQYLQKTTSKGERYIDFLESKRIELNTIINAVKSKRFWEWVSSQLLELFPNRDYNRAIEVPDYVLTPTMEKFLQKLRVNITHVLGNRIEKNKKKINNIEGFINTQDRLQKIEKTFFRVLSKDPLIRQIHQGMKEFETTILDSEDGDSP